MSKKQLGQFFTKNSGYILQGFAKYIKNKNVIDPFAGGSDLIKRIPRQLAAGSEQDMLK